MVAAIRSHQEPATKPHKLKRFSLRVSADLLQPCPPLAHTEAHQRIDDDFTIDDANASPWIDEQLVPTCHPRRPVRPFASVACGDDREAGKITAACVVPTGSGGRQVDEEPCDGEIAMRRSCMLFIEASAAAPSLVRSLEGGVSCGGKTCCGATGMASQRWSS